MVIIEFQSEKAILLVIGICYRIDPSSSLTDLYMGSLALSLYQRMSTGESLVLE